MANPIVLTQRSRRKPLWRQHQPHGSVLSTPADTAEPEADALAPPANAEAEQAPVAGATHPLPEASWPLGVRVVRLNLDDNDSERRLERLPHALSLVPHHD